MDWKSMIKFKDMDDLVSEALQRMRALKTRITDLNIGGIFRTLIELSSRGTADLYQLLLAVLPQGFPTKSSGCWLDLHCEGMGLQRKPAKRTTGIVKFARKNASGSLRIPTGSTVKTDMSPRGAELRFITTQDVIIPDGATTALVPVKAEHEGARYNVGPSYISKLVTYVSGIEYVTNEEGWILEEGADLEDDDSLLKRYLGRWDELSTGSTGGAYASWARSIPGVMDVSVDEQFPRGQGTVDVIITGPAGAPSAELIKSVQEFVEKQKPICDNVLVKGPELVPVKVQATVWMHPSRGDRTVIRARATEALNGLFIGPQSLRIGEDLYKAKMTALLMAVSPDIVNVTVDEPSGDTIVEPSQLCVLSDLDVQVQRAVSI